MTLAEQQEALTQKYVRQAQDRERAVAYNREYRQHLDDLAARAERRYLQTPIAAP